MVNRRRSSIIYCGGIIAAFVFTLFFPYQLLLILSIIKHVIVRFIRIQIHIEWCIL